MAEWVKSSYGQKQWRKVKNPSHVSSVIWWARQDLNLGPMDYESTALTAELRARREVFAVSC
jgi:hypothetical protein